HAGPPSAAAVRGLFWHAAMLFSLRAVGCPSVTKRTTLRVTLRVGSVNAVAISVLPVRSASIVLVVPLNGKALIALAMVAIGVPRVLFGVQMLPVNSARLDVRHPRFPKL